MKFRTALTVALASGSVLAAGSAAAAVVVTLNPGANNNGNGTISPGTAAFQATGGTLTLGSASNPAVLTIGASSGVTGFSESGRIQLNSFTNPAYIGIPAFNSDGTVPGTGLNSTYGLYVDFMFSGAGAWVAPNQYQASQAGASFIGNLFAISASNVTYQLGTLSLLPTATAFGIATTINPPVANGTGTANTTFSASLNFDPAPGTTGINGFFQAPMPFEIDIALGSVGGNDGNTRYSVDGAGVVTITTPANGQSPSTGNFTFVSEVPEPGVLSLAGIALLGLAAVTARRKNRAAATV